MLCVTQSEGGKTGSLNMSENLSNKAEIYRSLALGSKGGRGPFYSLSSMPLAPIAKRLLDSYNNVNQAALCDLQMVFIKELKKHSST